MTEQPGLPSESDLDQMAAEINANQETTAPPPPESEPPLQHDPELPTAPPPPDIVNRHGERFEKAIHATLPDGTPKEDSTGRYIRIEHDYRGPRPSAQFPQ